MGPRSFAPSVLVMAISISDATPSSGAGPNCPAENLDAGVFRSLVEKMAEASPTFRQQCLRLAAAPELKVELRASPQSPVNLRARTEISRNEAGMIATVVVFDARHAAELIGHEIEHIIERLDGVHPGDRACAGTRKHQDTYETCRAVEVGKRVAHEYFGRRPWKIRKIRQDDSFGQPLDPATAAVSPGGRFVVLRSHARLTPEDANDDADLYVFDAETGTLHLETRRPGWADPYRGFLQPSMSADGRWILFRALTDAPDLPGRVVWRPVLYDRTAGTARGLSVGDESGVLGYGAAAISADGGTVVMEVVVDRAGGTELHAIRPQTGDVEPVSAATGSTAPGHGVTPAVSASGRYIAFASVDDLTCARPASCSESGRDRAGHADIYLRDMATRTTFRVSRSERGGDPNGQSSWPAISADGRHVAFNSEASNLVRGDDNGAQDVFVHDVDTRTTERVSQRPDGKSANGPSRFPALSGDGSVIAFQSLASDLSCAKRCAATDRDINLLWDVFVLDRRHRRVLRASADRMGEWMHYSRRPSLDHSGRVLVFSSRHPIEDDDLDNDEDLFIKILPGIPPGPELTDGSSATQQPGWSQR